MKTFDNIKSRRSVRTFLDKPLRSDTLEYVEQYLDTLKILKGPFGHQTTLSLIDISKNKKVGTYGIIKNPAKYIIGTIDNTIEGLMDYGYLFEKMILDFNEKKIGTCWMAGTFKREDFASVKGEGLMPAVTPIGYYDNTRFFENMMRKVVKSDLRLPFEQLFFDGSFDKSLNAESAGHYNDVLEAIRLGPSASNKQPWRILKIGDELHLYLEENKKYNETLSFKLQYLDIGIAMYHLETMCKDYELKGSWVKEAPQIELPNENYHYVISYK